MRTGLAAVPRAVPATARFGLIGCGSVGSLLDEDAPSAFALTHASALGRSTRARLVAVCDTDADRAVACARARGVERWYVDAAEMLAAETLDAVIVATPPAGRRAVVDAALRAGIRLLWLEKPAAATLPEAERLGRAAADAGVIVAVNHLRRWATLADLLRRSVAGIGPLRSVTGTYGKGLANNGSHLLDLVTMVAGEPRAGRVVRVVDDGRAEDATVDAELDLPVPGGRTVPLSLRGTDHRNFSVFELEFIGGAGRVRVSDLGRNLTVEVVEADPVFPGYRRLAPPAVHAGLLDGMFERALDQLVDVLDGKDPRPLCGLDEAKTVLRVLGLLRPLDETR